MRHFDFDSFDVVTGTVLFGICLVGFIQLFFP